MQNLSQIQNVNVESLSTRENLEKDDKDRIVVEQFSISLFCIYSSLLEFGMLSLICIQITMYTISCCMVYESCICP